jgi:hypothetical protein
MPGETVGERGVGHFIDVWKVVFSCSVSSPLENHMVPA